MRTFAIVFLAGLLAVLPSQPGFCGHRDICITNLHKWQMDDIEYEIDDGSLFLSHDGRKYETIEITDEYELFVNDVKVKLNADQQELVAEYYDTVTEIVAGAKRIGWEGVQIGLAGAALGMKAVGGVVKMIFTSYDEDDLDYDMDREAEKLERRADKLEKKAEVLEDLANNMDDIADQMTRDIPELGKLRWF